MRAHQASGLRRRSLRGGSCRLESCLRVRERRASGLRRRSLRRRLLPARILPSRVRAPGFRPSSPLPSAAAPSGSNPAFACAPTRLQAFVAAPFGGGSFRLESCLRMRERRASGLRRRSLRRRLLPARILSSRVPRSPCGRYHTRSSSGPNTRFGGPPSHMAAQLGLVDPKATAEPDDVSVLHLGLLAVVGGDRVGLPVAAQPPMRAPGLWFEALATKRMKGALDVAKPRHAMEDVRRTRKAPYPGRGPPTENGQAPRHERRPAVQRLRG
jgi:hypothetical protein